MWRGLVRASWPQLYAYMFVTCSAWKRFFMAVCLCQCLLTYWEPSGLWNSHRRPQGWEVQSGCPRLYEPIAWPAVTAPGWNADCALMTPDGLLRSP